MICFKSMFALAAVLIGSCFAQMNYGKYQDEYNSFLDMVDNQDIEREYNFRFSSPSPDVASKYEKDRHGRIFVKCAYYNSSSDDEPMNIRCPMKASYRLPGCFQTHNFNTGETLQGCWEFDKEDTTCTDECDMTVRSHKSRHTKIQVTVGFCCCATKSCNVKSKDQILASLEKYNQKKMEREAALSARSAAKTRKFMEDIPSY